MEPSFKDDEEGAQLYRDVTRHFREGNYIKALEIIDDLILVHGEDKDAWHLRLKEGHVFLGLAQKAESPDVKVAFLLGSVECLSEDDGLSPLCANSLHMLGKKLGSVLYLKKAVEKAKHGLTLTWAENPAEHGPLSLEDQKVLDEKNNGLLEVIRDAESRIASSKTLVGSTMKNSEQRVWESKKSPDPREDTFKRLRLYWVGLDVRIKRDFLKVSVAKLTNFVVGLGYYKAEGRDALEQVLASAKKDRKWSFWICRTLCSKKFSSAEECKNHLEQQHAVDFKLSSEKDMVKRIGKDWARKISVGSWEPVDAVAAVEMINNRLADVKAFASKSKSGWSKEWPIAVDEERSKLLKEIKLLLVSFCDKKILSGSLRDWMMRFPVKHLVKLEVSQQSIVDLRLVETPQSICFLESHELSQILDFLNNIKCERNDGTDAICRAVDSFLGRTRVKEKIDFDPGFSYLLLDKRLLKSNTDPAPFDDEGTISVFDPSAHYAKAPAHGDDIISWLTDYNSVDKTFPRPIREHNLDIWLAVLKAVQFTCKTLGTKYAKKVQVLDYDAALTIIKNMCISEDKRRRNLQEDQWNRYASLLCDRCEEEFPGNSTKLFLCAVRDVLEGALRPTFDFPDLEDGMNLIRDRKSLSDDRVLKSIDLLKSVVTHKVLLIDSKILLIDNSRISLLNNLSRLSIFDNRTYMLQLLKPFLLSEIVTMESKAKSDAAEAELLLEEEKKPQSVKKNRSNKKTSTSKSRPRDKTVEHKPSVNLEHESTSSSLKTVAEDSMEPEDALANEIQEGEHHQLEEDYSVQNNDDPDLQNPGEDSLLEHLEPAAAEATTRYNSAFDVTLKALLNIKIFKEDLMRNRQPFHDHLEEQVPSALQKFFDAVVSEVIKNDEGIYSSLLSNLLAYLEEVHSMSSKAAEVLVAIFEFWHGWKNQERESLVTRLFTLEENERMSCTRCRRKSNYPEQRSYGIVMAADSIRDLKCSLGNMEFVDIIKVIRMEFKMFCDLKTGGCGKTNFVHHIISKRPPIFIIVLEWEKSETEKEVFETTKALEWEIDISRLYEGVEPNTNYRLVSMVGCGEEEEEHICIVYEKNRWVKLRRTAFEGEVVGNWKNVVRYCGERKVRPEILFYEAVSWIA
ncbi:PREDICTED: uncharacterized protein LOC104762312 isoform X1 [Camelina sativa]|uniref:Uncharacterized protein LOC104762312 isoform X1 n=1 Tax=Camelina sativa TaxID=90675 RepID=A0ABM1RAP7_CAMSA|nr:PREDICTED: uncharacterized protein LOC104762312 isoform X1 [Camelina sativa]